MVDNVIVTPSASYTVAAEDIGASVEVQRVKIVLGTVDVDGGNVGTTNPMPISGTVAVPAGLSVSAQVSGTVTVAAGLSVSAVVSGTVTAAVPAGLSVSAVVSGTVTAVVTGAVSISAMPAVSISVSAVLGTVVTVLGTVAVNVVAGGAAPGTTAATQSAISGQVVWLAPTQTVTATVNTIAAGFSVQALVTGPVSISAMPAVSISVSAALGTVITILGTQVVSVVPGVSVNALVTGVVSVSVLPAVSISVSAALGTVITILGTQVVSVVPGLSVSAQISGVVSVSVLPAVSISVSAILGTVVTVLGTVLVSQAGLVFTTAIPTVTATGPIFWLANTVTVTVTATVTGSLIISGIAPATTALVSGNTGMPVWPGTPPYAAVLIAVTSTALASGAATLLMTVWTGAALATAAASFYVVPAGKQLRVLSLGLVMHNSITTTPVLAFAAVLQTAGAPAISATTPQAIRVAAAIATTGIFASGIAQGQQDIAAGVSVGMLASMNTTGNIDSIVAVGYLF